MKTYADRLRSAMAQSKITIAQLGRELGISYQGVKKVIDGDTKSFTAINNNRAALILGVNPEWLATGNGHEREASAAPEIAVRKLAASDLVERRHPALTPMATEIGLLFDLLTDRVQRAVVYNKVTQVILGAIEQNTHSPSAKPADTDPLKK